jgi:dihydroorotate dehydrogenase
MTTKALRLLPPEPAHRATINLLKTPLAPRSRLVEDAILKTKVGTLALPNPLGLAAGFDKNAEVPGALLRLGFGFIEVGAVTPKPQPGNPSPRVFRLEAERAVINRYGFNNDGLAVIAERLERQHAYPGIVGINLGANKDTEDKVQDYVTGLKRLERHVAFLTINISSPNTAGLRDLQGKAALDDLLSRVLAARETTTPVFLKVAPDLSDKDKADIAASAFGAGIDGLIVSNTTLSRTGLSGSHAGEAGGLSGAPLFHLSTEVLRDFARELGGKVPLIGVGGIRSAQDALVKIKAGASAVQLYTALVYDGPGLVRNILKELPSLLRAEGLASMAEAVGCATTKDLTR